jgi:uncharacterized membrane protein
MNSSFKSDISGIEFPITERISGRTVRKSLLNFIRQTHPEFTSDQYLSVSELTTFRENYIAKYLTNQIGELSELEQTVLSSINNQSILSDREDDNDAQAATFGQRIADKVASFGGSWTFIISFGVFILIWICLNIIWLQNKAFDPYPFILLNLILSCLAALQAPVIMMSQNRQEEKDRERAKKDYMINLKSELEIRALHEKIDHLIMDQQQELLEIQKTQIDMMRDILTQISTNNQSDQP